METEFGLRRGLLLVFLLENVYQIRAFKGSGTSGRLIVQDFFLLFMKCLFTDPIVVMLTLLTLKTLLQVNVKLLYQRPVNFDSRIWDGTTQGR